MELIYWEKLEKVDQYCEFWLNKKIYWAFKQETSSIDEIALT